VIYPTIWHSQIIQEGQQLWPNKISINIIIIIEVTQCCKIRWDIHYAFKKFPAFHFLLKTQCPLQCCCLIWSVGYHIIALTCDDNSFSTHSHSCPYADCNLMFTTKHYMKRHQERAHNRPFKVIQYTCIHLELLLFSGAFFSLTINWMNYDWFCWC